MSLQDIIDTTETISELDERRRETFKTEFEAFEVDDTTNFSRTRKVIQEERGQLQTLSERLNEEDGNIEELVDYADFLTVDQAVRHRDQTIEKLRKHNDHLQEFHDAMEHALNIIESNIDALRQNAPEAIEEDPNPYLEQSREALKHHNEAVEDLGKNMTILNAYFI